MTDSKVYCNSASMTTVIIDLINAEAGDNAMLMYEHTLVGNVELTPFVLWQILHLYMLCGVDHYSWH